MFLKEKHDGTIKGQGCFDGIEKPKYITKEKEFSLMVIMEAVILYLLINYLENMVTVTADITRSFIQADKN